VTSKRTPEELLAALEGEIADDEMERVLALSDDDRRGELREADADLRAIDATVRELHGQIARAAAAHTLEEGESKPRVRAAPAAVVPLDSRERSRWVIWLAAATLGGVGLVLAAMNSAVIVAWWGGREDIRADDGGLLRGSPMDRANELRDEAEQACKRRLWGLCETKLDEAQQLHPGGENEPRVQRMREDIEGSIRVEASPEIKGRRP
jgi:hypothetical protein